VEVGALEVRHGLKVLLPHEVLLITNREERDRHLSGSDEVAFTQGGEGDECRLLDGAIELTVDDDLHPQLQLVEGYCQTELTHVLVIGLRHATVVERDVSDVAETDECVI
jgi:hypothetical protein